MKLNPYVKDWNEYAEVLAQCIPAPGNYRYRYAVHRWATALQQAIKQASNPRQRHGRRAPSE